MAQRPPRTTLRRPQAPDGPVYEDFKPISEWKQEEESDILLIFLPGFMRDQIRVTTEGQNILRVRGERLVAGNKWNSFVEDFQVPEYCNIRGIRAKFEGGILTVTMPKKSTSIPQPQVDPKVEGKTTQEVPLRITLVLAPPLISRPTTSGTNTDKQENIDRDDQTRERKEMTETKGLKEMVKSTEKGKEPLKPENEVKPISERGKQVGEGSGSGYKEEDRKHISKTTAEETTKVTDYGAGAGAGVGEHISKTKAEETTKVTDSGAGAGAGAGGYNLESYNKKVVKKKKKKVVKGLVKGLDEKRQLMVHVGVAVLVIVALGAYVYFTYGSSRKPEN